MKTGFKTLYTSESSRLSTNRLISDGFSTIQAPELRDSQGNLDPLGIRAKIQADNYAMGITNAPNIDSETAAYLATNPEVFEQYNQNINPHIQEAIQQGTFKSIPTGKKDVYNRNLVTMQNTSSPMDQGEFLTSTGNTDSISLTGIPMSVLSALP